MPLRRRHGAASEDIARCYGVGRVLLRCCSGVPPVYLRYISFVSLHRTGGPVRFPFARHNRVGFERKVMLPFHLSLHLDIDARTRRRFTEILVAAIATRPGLPASPYINM